MIVPGLVTIVMPAYNGATYLQQAIDSVLAQTYPVWELIVVDDGSTDNTAAIVTTYRDSRIRYTYQKNRGQAAALNQGLGLAQGEYITTLDTDDWFTPNSLLDRVNFLNTHADVGVVYGDGYYCDATGKLIRRFSQYRIGNISGDVYPLLIATPFFGTGGNVMVRWTVFENYQLRYDESIVWCQDYDLYIRMAEKVTFGVIDTATIWYRIHDANMTKTTPAGQRLLALIRTKYKVLASDHFRTIQPGHKSAFFYYFLLIDLCDQSEAQNRLVNTPQFHTLPKAEQAKLMRLVANYYLLQGKHDDFARAWLRKAWTLAPFHSKTIALVLLAHLHPLTAKQAVKWWRRFDPRQQEMHQSPFEKSAENR
ncbi:MAG: glycosyltransferase [Caldilinea sp. CFX5]|nr:glycosyltransferase [Caldilinea sp. CFX5]